MVNKRVSSKIRTTTLDSKSSHKSESKKGLETAPFWMLYLLIGAIAVGLLGQIIRWQFFEHEYYLTIAKQQYKEVQRLQSGRGSIFSIDGTVLATDQPAWDIYASLSSIPDERKDFFREKSRFVKEVSLILQIDEKQLDSKLTDEFRYVKISTGVSTDIKKELEGRQIFQEKRSEKSENFKRGTGFGLYFEKSEKRVYPDGRLASHILGFMGKDENGNDMGLYGIEGFYFGDISGTDGYTYEEIDAHGNIILTAEYDPLIPRSGKDITLTINSKIQKTVETILKQSVEKYQARSGSVIIMDPNTGAIIAMASYPDYNPNEYWRIQDPWIYKNKAIGDVYEPGSVFKPITVAIGLETGVIDENTICNDATGKLVIFAGTPDEKTIQTWDRKPDGKLTPAEYLQYSNNPCIAQTALAVGHEKYYPIMKEFGIGEYVGIGLQDESNAYLLPYEYWTKLDLAVTSFGQAVSTTPLQMLSAISAIANEGNRMRPYIVEKVSEEDELIQYTPKVIAQPVSKDTADKVAQMMALVPRKGDGSFFFNQYLPDYDIAGKTGTAQVAKLNEAGYYTDKTNTTFVGFAPSTNAQMAMIVKLEQPKTDPYAASTAVPLWVEIFMNIADDLEIPKKR